MAKHWGNVTLLSRKCVLQHEGQFFNLSRCRAAPFRFAVQPIGGNREICLRGGGWEARWRASRCCDATVQKWRKPAYGSEVTAVAPMPAALCGCLGQSLIKVGDQIIRCFCPDRQAHHIGRSPGGLLLLFRKLAVGG